MPACHPLHTWAAETQSGAHRRQWCSGLSAAVGLLLGAQDPYSVWGPMDLALVQALPPSSWMRPQQASTLCTRCAGESGEPVSGPGWLPGGRRLPVVGAITGRQVLGLAGRGPGGHLPGAHAQT